MSSIPGLPIESHLSVEVMESPNHAFIQMRTPSATRFEEVMLELEMVPWKNRDAVIKRALDVM